jgi:hypothetical protein
MKRSLTTLFAALLVAGTSCAALAQPAQPSREAMREKMKNMTPEERAAAKEKARARWESMTPEEQAAAKKRFAERHPEAAKRLKEKAANAPASAPN